MHLINIGWAGHATHHSSEYLNFSTSVRQSAFGLVFGWMYALYLSINLFFQMWVHTELVGKMHPFIELIFNTPSHHRVHHARNPEYIDKNYAGIFIIWDRMFGTFTAEKSEPVYGLVHPLRTWDAIWAQVHHLVYIYQEASKYSKITNKVAVVFAPPGWTISEKTNSWIPPEIVPIDYTQPKYQTYLPRQITVYLLVLTSEKYSFVDSLVLCAYIIYCLQTYGKILDNSAHSYAMEVVRIACDFVIALYFIRDIRAQSTFFQIVLSVYYVLLVFWFSKLQDQFKTLGIKKVEPPQHKERVGTGSQ